MLFAAEINDFRIVYNVLKSVSFREFAVLRPMDEGLKFTLEEMRCVETSVYIPSDLFTTYFVKNDEDIVLKINLKLFSECLNIFGDDGDPTMGISYKSVGDPLCLTLKHNQENITVDCEIRTMNVDSGPYYSLSEECNLFKVIISSSIFVEILHRLDNMTDEIRLTVSPDIPYLTLTATGFAGESEVSISKYSDSISVYQCDHQVQALYAFSNLRHILKAMCYANKIAISMGESGLLGLQLLMNSGEKKMYVEYYVTSQFSEE